MHILSVDIGTGTQDIFLYNTQLDVENGFKLVMPSPTMIVHRRIQAATRQRQPILLTGVTMGGGPGHWATEAHLRAGLEVFATPDAARSFNDDLEVIAEMGIQVVSDEEAARLPEAVLRLELKDFDFDAIHQAFQAFGVSLAHLDLLGVAVFDHGAAPPHVSDRRFRFDYLARRIQAHNSLSTFAYRAGSIPPEMTRMKAVAHSAARVQAPLLVMDTAPAAVLGATLDPRVRARERSLITNVGNFHTLAFRLGPSGIEGVFEHHTGLMTPEKLARLLCDFADGTLTNEFVFQDMGHGALVVHPTPYRFTEEAGVIVTGPRRNILHGSALNPYFAVPYGDMMLAGCFGMLAASAEVYPEWGEEIRAGLFPEGRGTPPWEGVE